MTTMMIMMMTTTTTTTTTMTKMMMPDFVVPVSFKHVETRLSAKNVWKRSSKWVISKTPAFRFSVDGKQKFNEILTPRQSSDFSSSVVFLNVFVNSRIFLISWHSPFETMSIGPVPEIQLVTSHSAGKHSA